MRRRRFFWGLLGAAVAVSWALMLGLGHRPQVLYTISIPIGVARTEHEVLAYDFLAGKGEERITYFEADGRVLTSFTTPFEDDGVYPYLVYALVAVAGASVAGVALGVRAGYRRGAT